jgi:hypothetical protein
MRKYLIPLLIVLLFLVPQTGRAQDEIQLRMLEINLWPEYDRASMLVIYKIQLPPSTTLPYEVTLSIPSAAGRPYRVAFMGEDGYLYQIDDYGFQMGSEWGTVTFRTPTANIQLEYYDPRLFSNGTDRTYEYLWPGDYSVDSAVIVVQCPLDSSRMQFIPENSMSIVVQCSPDPTQFQSLPAGVTRHIGQDNLLYYAYQIGALAKGHTYDFSLNYQKSSNILTWDKIRVQEKGPLPQSMWIRGLPWALGVLALVLIAGGVWFYWRSGLPQAGERKRRWRKPVPAAGSEASGDESSVYCHRCGRRATPGDVFCRSCGTKLRI